VFEQRSADPDLKKVHGIHAHILLYRGRKAKYDAVRELKRSFQKLLDTDNYQLFNIKHCGHQEATRKITYMTGDKQGTEKQLKQIVDKAWREVRGLEQYYNLDMI
jgi:hypothetical protein